MIEHTPIPQSLLKKKELEWFEERIVGHLVEGPYLEAQGVSRSALGRWFDSAHAYWNPPPKKEETQDMSQGTMFDLWMLSRDSFWSHYAPYEQKHPDGTVFERVTTYKTKPDKVEQVVSKGLVTRENKEHWEQWKKDNQEKLPATNDDLENLKAMAAAVMASGPASVAFRGTYFLRVPLQARINSVLVKCELDVLKIGWSESGLVIYPFDLKRLDDVSPKWFKKSCHDFHYDVQDALYCMILEQVFPHPCHVAPMQFICTEWSKSPRVHVYQINEDDRQMARDWVLDKLEKIKDGYNPPHEELHAENGGVQELNIKTWKYYE